MPKSCSAFKCTKRYNKTNPEITFHRFPFSKPSVLKQWLDNIGRDDFHPRKHMVICSLHFTPDCFSGFGNRRNLLWNAVPTIFTIPPEDAKQTVSKKIIKRPADKLDGIARESKDSSAEDAQRLEKDTRLVSYINLEAGCQTTMDLAATDHTYAILDPCTTKAHLFEVLDANIWLQKRLQTKCRVIKRMRLKLQGTQRQLLTLRRKVERRDIHYHRQFPKQGDSALKT
ncbi:THAP domain-containing protein 3 [Paramisgurnus dabryanus]|uniref:THAP domain-containing protein 3 n=1 Tax=Paramisgurnus dabryanus TaxID=90735 RepID=UPI0031F46973